MKDIKGFIKRHLTVLIVSLIALVGFIAFTSLKESKESKLKKIYNEMQAKREIASNAILAKYADKDVPPELIQSAQNEAIVIAQTSPEYKNLEKQADDIENETPSPFWLVVLGVFILMISVPISEIIAYCYTKIPFTEQAEGDIASSHHLIKFYKIVVSVLSVFAVLPYILQLIR